MGDASPICLQLMPMASTQFHARGAHGLLNASSAGMFRSAGASHIHATKQRHPGSRNCRQRSSSSPKIKNQRICRSKNTKRLASLWQNSQKSLQTIKHGQKSFTGPDLNCSVQCLWRKVIAITTGQWCTTTTSFAPRRLAPLARWTRPQSSIGHGHHMIRYEMLF